MPLGSTRYPMACLSCYPVRPPSPGLQLIGRLWPWRADGYGPPVRYPAMDEVGLLTPPSLARVLRAGYRPAVHDSAGISWSA
jgi:hypothetical protein